MVGLKNLKAKKRDMSLLFNPINEVSERPDVKNFNTGKGSEVFWLVNRSKNQFTNPLVLFLFIFFYFKFMDVPNIIFICKLAAFYFLMF